MNKMGMILMVVMVVLLAGISRGECPTMDFTGDCRVDLADFAEFAHEWLDEGQPTPDGMVWIHINDPGVSGYERFTIDMSKYETTNAQYCYYLNAALASGDIIVSGSHVKAAGGINGDPDFTGHGLIYYDLLGPGYTYNGATNGGAARINWTGSSFTVDGGFENHPVTYITWYGATAFASYYGWRLPAELEWQAVADFNGSYIYGCGLTIDNSEANYYNSAHPNGTTPVGAYGVYGYGLADMAGNVCEWTSSLYDPYDPDDRYRVYRGGCCISDVIGCEVDFRAGYYPDDLRFFIGFRVCR